MSWNLDLMFKISKKPLGSQRLSFYEDKTVSLTASLASSGVNIDSDGSTLLLGDSAMVVVEAEVKVIIGAIELGKFNFDLFPFPEGDWVYIGLNFYQDDKLFDSPTIFGRGNDIFGYVGCGQAFNLCVNKFTKADFDFKRHNFENEIIASLGKFILGRYPDSDLGLKINIGSADIWKAGFMCLIRKLYPDAYIELDELPSDELSYHNWLRLMQNLGVVCAKAPRNKSTKLIKMNVDEFVALAEILGRKPIMAKLSGVSSIIPQKLIQHIAMVKASK